jgi:uncharacterized damage-inducible protein DinB
MQPAGHAGFLDFSCGGTGNIVDNSTTMNPLLHDFCGHQGWADAEHWRAIEAHPAAAQDAAIKHRLHHIHLVQHWYLWAAGDRRVPFTGTKPEDFTSVEALKAYARDYHEQIARFVSTVSDARLADTMSLPVVLDPPLEVTVTEGLTHCAMHSHYHRGQNATRLRELGVEPPSTDLIVWYWKNRPAPAWTSG